MSNKQLRLQPKNLIQPYFVVAGRNKKQPIPHMPGIFRFSPDSILRDIAALLKTGVRGVLLFGIARKKDGGGSDAYDDNAAIQSAVRAIRKRFGKKLVIITDVCLCGFASHGHCGILQGKKIDSRKTLQALGKIAVSHAEAGADFVAPSAMTTGQVKAVRGTLNRAGFRKTGIWAYAIKYASSFYGPFRGALGSSPKFGDRKAYQMNPADSARALKSALRDAKNGAGVLMVKPALPYLDMIHQLRSRTHLPVAAYQVSGEYAMMKCSAGVGIINEKETVLESLRAMRRAGADQIVTYYAKEAAQWLR